MMGVLAPLAKFLISQPIGPNSQRAAPCFGYYEFNQKKSELKQVQDEMKAAINAYIAVTEETPDQVAVHDFGGMLEALLPIQTTMNGLVDLESFEGQCLQEEAEQRVREAEQRRQRVKEQQRQRAEEQKRQREQRQREAEEQHRQEAEEQRLQEAEQQRQQAEQQRQRAEQQRQQAEQQRQWAEQQRQQEAQEQQRQRAGLREMQQYPPKEDQREEDQREEGEEEKASPQRVIVRGRPSNTAPKPSNSRPGPSSTYQHLG